MITSNNLLFYYRMPVSEVRSGQTASFALKKVKRSQIRKGMVMVSAKLNPTHWFTGRSTCAFFCFSYMFQDDFKVVCFVQFVFCI